MATEDSRNSAVVDALALGQIEHASLLLKEGSPLDLQRAAEVVIDKGQYEALKFLFSNYKLDVDKNFLLHRALVVQQEDVANFLIESGADVNSEKGQNFLRNGEEGCAHYSHYLPLQLSLFCSLDMPRLVLESRADINRQNYSGETPLIFACRMSLGADHVTFLLENGASVQETDCHDTTALHWAVRVGNIETVKLLTDHGVDIEAKDVDGCTALMWACRNSKGKDCLKVLLEKGASCHSKNIYEEMGLHVAAKSGNSMALKLLIQYGTQLEARTYDGDTALILACGESVPAECVRILLENGAFPNVQNTDKKTPLNIAKEARNEEKIQMLLQYGATDEDRIDQKTDLMLACGKTGNVKSVLSLLENNATPNVKNQRGETALHIAADKGDIETLKVLVQYKADMNSVTNDDETPLMLACANSSVNVLCVQFLLENNALLNVTDIRGDTALHMAIRSRDIEKVKILVQYGADVNVKDRNKKTPLMLACLTQSVNAECVKFLLEKKALPNVRNTNGETALHTALVAGDIEKLKVLLRYGADVNTRDKNDLTPLMLACAKNSLNVECVKFLLEKNALPNLADTNGNTALHTALLAGDIEKVKILVQHGADVNVMDRHRKTPLIVAYSKISLNVECLKFLLENKALPDVRDIRGDTALHRTLRSGDIEKLKILVQYGADVNVRGKNGQTPLMLACTKNLRNVECVKFLLENKALPNVTDSKGQTVLHLLMLPNLGDWKRKTALPMDEWSARAEKIKLLVEHGADLEAKTVEGRTPFLIAAQTRNRQLIELLHDLGADVCAEDREGQNAIMLAMEIAHRNRKTCDQQVLQSLIHKGVPVNHRDKNGWTPLMLLAITDGNVATMKCLTEAGADVHAVGIEQTETCRQEITALSILMEGGSWWDKTAFAKELITLGAVNCLPERCNDFLHHMIRHNQSELIHLFLTNGMSPTLTVRLPWVDLVGPVSPLTVALADGKIPVIQYLLGNLVLCPCDIGGHPYFTEWRSTLISRNRTDVVTLMDEFYSQPKSLFQLSFVTVSRALGGVPGRVDRVNSLPLPSKFKDKLLFKSIDVFMDLEKN